MLDARAHDWTIAPALGWCAFALVAVLVLREGGIGALTRLLTEAPAVPTAAGPTFVSAADPTAPTDVAPPLPPPPDLTPAPRAAGGGAAVPEAVAGKTVEDVCVQPLGATTGCKRWAMDGIYAALAAGEGGHTARPSRVSFYGDSVSATDALPGRVRARLQDVFGDGGPGFIHAVKPHRFNHSEVVDRRSTGTWKTWGVSLSNVSDHLYGVGNSTAEGTGSIRLRPKTTSGKISKVEVYYLAQPGGGTAELKVGETTATLDTAAEKKAARFQQVAVADGAHAVELASTRGKVRLFGLSLERDTGIVVDNMALVSATAKTMLVNLTDHWKNQLTHRDADLIVIMLGTNEAQWLAGASAMAEYEKTWEDLAGPDPGGAAAGVVPGDVAARSGREPRRQDRGAARRPQDGGGPAQGGADRRLRLLGHVHLDGRLGLLHHLEQTRPAGERLRPHVAARFGQGRRRTGGCAVQRLQGLQGPLTYSRSLIWMLLSAVGASAGCNGPTMEVGPRVPATPEAAPDELAAGPAVDAGTGEAGAGAAASALTVPAGALDAFYAALDRAAATPADPSGRVGVVVFGDSHTAGDQLTGFLRRSLGGRFGDGGRGLVLRRPPADPPLLPARRALRRRRRAGPPSWGASATPQPFGIGRGSRLRREEAASAWVETCAQCGSDVVGRFEVLYLRRPTSGPLAYRVDDGPWQQLSTSARRRRHRASGCPRSCRCRPAAVATS